MNPLKPSPSLKDVQDYVANMEIERGFDHETVLETCLLLGEEVGELFKAVRKHQGMTIDVGARDLSVAHEVADIFIMLSAVANRLGVDIEQAVRDKEEINSKRVWKVCS